MNICVYGAASSVIDHYYIDIVEKLCTELGNHGHNLIFGAGDCGLMGAAARGFKAGGGRVTGIVPSFFRTERVEALYEQSDQILFTQNMGTRKDVMEENSDAFIITPGGIGTFDEFFQILTLKQLKQHNKPIALFNINGYYYSIQALVHNGVEEKFIKDHTLDMYRCFDEKQIPELIEYVETPPEENMLRVEDMKFGGFEEQNR